jgi:hypothetical protein
MRSKSPQKQALRQKANFHQMSGDPQKPAASSMPQRYKLTEGI